MSYLKKIFLYILFVGPVQNSCYSAQDVQNLIENPDIHLPSIPELVLSFYASSSNCEIPSDFLKFCRLIMFTIPMDIEASVLDLNKNVNIPILEHNKKHVSYDYHPLQLAKNRKLVSDYIGGRNVVLTQDNKGPVVIVTGIGPKYGVNRKQDICEAMGARVYDLIDLLPLQKGAVDRDHMRDLFISARYLHELSELLPSTENQNITEVEKEQIKRCLNELNSLVLCKENVAFKIILRKIYANFVIKNSEIFSHDILQQFHEIKQKNEEQVKRMLPVFFQGLRTIVEKHLGIDYKQRITAFSLLEQLENSKDFQKEIVLPITSLDSKVISASLSGLNIGDENHKRALGDLFHSEMLYILWRERYAESPAPYFFTQRDMCSTCNPLIISYAFSRKFSPLIVLSARIFNRDGNQSFPVDQIFQLNTKKNAWVQEKPPGLRPRNI